MLSFGTDQLSLGLAMSYVMPITQLIYFCENVPLDDKSEISFLYKDNKNDKKCAIGLKKAYQVHKIKALKPIGRLCQRFIQENKGLTEIHLIYFQIVIIQNAYQQGLWLIRTPCFVKSLNTDSYCQYLEYAVQIVCALQLYPEAYEIISKVKHIQCSDIKLKVNFLKFTSLLNHIMGCNEGLNTDFTNMDGRHKIGLLKSHKYHQNINIQEDYDIQKQIKVYKKIAHYQKLQPEDINQLKKDNFYQLYLNLQQIQLRQYIKKQLKQDNWRIKIKQIKNKDASSFKILKNINKLGQIYKYDCKNGIAYFNHRQNQQQDVNKLITKCSLIYKQIKQFNQRKKTEEKYSSRGYSNHMFGSRSGFH